MGGTGVGVRLRLLFLFLGLPGAVLAALLTAAVTGAGATRRRREQALLRSRGASYRQVMRLAAVEAAVVGIIGCLAGLAGAALVGALGFGSARFGATTATAAAWTGAAAAAGMAIAMITVLLPARRDARESTVATGRLTVGHLRRPRWLRYGLDLVLLAAAAAVYGIAGQNGYKLVLALEGVPTISVSYWAFAAPALLWIGAGLLTWRLADLLLGRGRHLLGTGLRVLSGGLSGTIAAGMSRQRRQLGRSIVLLALALSFAASTAVFNATYRQQAQIDALLTNGADVTVTTSPGAATPAGEDRRLAHVQGVKGVEPLQHRFAYVGSDLQDLYGVRPGTITNATALQDAYFTGGTARQLMRTLAARPDSILVSAEPSPTSSSTPATRSTCGCRTGGPNGAPPSRSTTRAWSRSSRPRPRTASSSTTPPTSPKKPAAARSAPSSSTPAAGTSPPSPTASATCSARPRPSPTWPRPARWWAPASPPSTWPG